MVKVLIAEDDVQLHKIYGLMMQKAGFEAKVVLNGEEVMKTLQGFKPDVILLDLLMPKKDGEQTLREIKTNPEYLNIPVLITSNISKENEVIKLKQMGAADFVVKSDFSTDAIIEKIKSVTGGAQ